MLLYPVLCEYWNEELVGPIRNFKWRNGQGPRIVKRRVLDQLVKVLVEFHA